MTVKNWYSSLPPEKRDEINKKRRGHRRDRGKPEIALTREQFYRQRGEEPPPWPQQEAA